MAAIKCPKCGHYTSDQLKHCVECGKALDGVIASSGGETSANDIVQHKKNKHLHRSAIVISVLFLLLAGGVTFFLVNDSQQRAKEEQTAFDKLMACQRVELCEDYLIRFPEGAHAAEVQQLCAELKQALETELKLDSVDWALAQQLNTTQSYEEYLTKHPEGAFVQMAEGELNRLSQLVVSEEEKEMLTGTIHTLLASLSSCDAEKVAPLLATSFSFGQVDAANADTLVSFYKAQFSHQDVLGVHFVVKGNLEITKVANDQPAQCDYELHAKLDATVNRTAVDSAGIQHWDLTARLTPDRRFSHLSLNRK
ncbi:MAG: hypothetical protein KBT12_06100 [Bacteroidales bacterium]|nr:hypothetical protein [Candidatus Physcousia equi]